MLAYLVIREGSKWTDIFRLVPGRTVTIGRSATNQIVVKDERCSRNHAEVFLTRGAWTLRDLDSRNGTLVGSERVQGDYTLTFGDVIRIAHCQLAFVRDPSEAFAEEARHAASGEETVAGESIRALSDSNILIGESPATITHRRVQTRFLEPVSDANSPATMLCRLAFELAKQQDVPSVGRLALDCTFAGTNVDAGAVLLVSPEAEDLNGTPELQLVVSRTDREPSYHRVSNFLAATVIREGEAVLARNVADDNTLGSPDSKGEIHSTSVICAPIRLDSKVIGLIHLYSTVEERMPDPDDLEFTLAVADNVARALNNLTQKEQLAETLSRTRIENVQLRSRLGAEVEIVGSSPLLRKLQQQVAQAAPSRATVLIRGESGVGKELVARAVHFASPREKGPFVCLNCAALSETLLESELFGHERGAFTGATDRKVGKFEAADQGTLMLDEIGEMSSSIQAKFLRVLEGHPFERVGGSKAIKVDVRVIAATNRDLEKAVSEKKFRADLYFRLHVIEISVPPLRKRTEDILEIASHYLEKYSTELGKRIRGFTPDAFEVMLHYRWPGNVRELKNVIERAVVLARSDYIGLDDLTLTNLATSSESGELPVAKGSYEPQPLAEVERRHIGATLNATGWNKSRAASILGIERSTLDRKIRRYKLEPPGGARGE